MKLSHDSTVGECRGGFAPSARGMGVPPRFILRPLSLAKGEGDTGGEGFWDRFNKTRKHRWDGYILLAKQRLRRIGYGVLSGNEARKRIYLETI